MNAWKRARDVAAVLALAAAASVDGSAAAQNLLEPPTESADAGTATDAATADAIAARRAAIDAELDALGGEDSDSPHDAAVRERLERIASLLELEAGLLAAADTAPKPVSDDLGAATETPSTFALNALYEESFAREDERRQRAEALAEARAALATAKENAETADRARRRARADAENATPGDAARAREALELRELESRAAREDVVLQTLEVRSAHAAANTESADDALAGRIEAVRDALSRGEGDPSAALEDLARRTAALRDERDAAERRLATASLRLDAAQNRFSRGAAPSPESIDVIEALTARRNAIRQLLELLDGRLERVEKERAIWQHWNALLRGAATRDELLAWEDDLEARSDALSQAEVGREARSLELERRVETLRERRSHVDEGTELHRALGEEADALRRLAVARRAESAALAAEHRLTDRVLEDVHDATGHVDVLEYAADAVRSARDAWVYEITTVDDSPITVGSLVLALVLFAAGLWIARRGSTLVARLCQNRFRVDAGAAHALETLSFYALLVGFTLLSLRAVHFPLTAFTVLGGALAIGIGFGSQNVMNNFISGLILMLERPVRARDVVEVDGNHGTIENIGARSTQIRSTDGRHIIVPNSFFLESNVVNWTLSDDLLRTKVRVGVVYGSPTRLVEELIRRIVEEEEQALSHPEPIVVFDEFGDNSLNFDVYFWVQARAPMALRKVESRIRFRIDDVFREHGIVIAFPQRDVHLDTVAPLEVRVVPGARARDGDPEPEPE